MKRFLFLAVVLASVTVRLAGQDSREAHGPSASAPQLKFHIDKVVLE